MLPHALPLSFSPALWESLFLFSGQGNGGSDKVWVTSMAPHCAPGVEGFGVPRRAPALGATAGPRGDTLRGGPSPRYSAPRTLVRCRVVTGLLVGPEAGDPAQLRRTLRWSRRRESLPRMCPEPGRLPCSFVGASALAFGLFWGLTLEKFFPVLLRSRPLVQTAPPA